MSNLYQRVRATACLLFLLSVTLLSHAQIADKATAKAAKVTPDLLQASFANNGAPLALPAELQGLRRVNRFITKDGNIAVEAFAAAGQDPQTLLAELQAVGLQEATRYDRIVFGYLPADKIDALKNIPSLQFARPVYQPKHNVGKVTSQADKAMRADLAKQQFNVTGAGQKVGVLSDSYNALGGAAAGVASGDLPPNVQVIDDISDGSDEGRAMCELIYDIAPGTTFAFNTAFKGEAAFAKGIRDLATNGCNIIVDDITYFLAPFFQDGIVAQAVNDVAANRNVSYFSAAGNDERHSYQSAFRGAGRQTLPGYGPAVPHNFSNGDIYQHITIPAGGVAPIVLQWDNPFFSVNGGAGAQTDMDLLVYSNGVLVPGLSSAADNLGDDPYEFIYLENGSNAPISFDLVIAKYAGPDPSLIKWVDYDNGFGITIEYDTRSSTIIGHSNAAGAISVGAARYDRTPAFNPNLTTARIEEFSSAGGTPILFNSGGQRIAAIVRQKPEITAADGTNTTFFGFDYESDGFPNFFGTSAAAPHAAGVAALMQQLANRRLSPGQVVSVMEQTALDMDDPATSGFDTGFDFGTGYGFIQADKALQRVGTLTPGTFAITAVTTVRCETVTAGLRRVNFTPQYTGINGQPITFDVINEMMPVTTSGPSSYTLNLYIDNPTIRLRAKQAGTPGEATFTYNWLQACNTAGARLGAGSEAGLRVRVLGNPVADELTVDVAGAQDGPLTLKLTDMQGRVIESRQVDQGSTTGRHTFNVSRQTPGLLLLHTTMGQQREVSKVLKK